MKILHICAGWQKWNGAANIARMIMGEQEREGHSVSFRTWVSIKELRAADEVWIHCSWMPCLWWAALWGKNVHWVPECSYDPIRRAYHGWKKTLVGPIERFCLRRAKTIVATCEAEADWIRSYLGNRCPKIEVTDIKRFFKLDAAQAGKQVRPIFPPATSSYHSDSRLPRASRSNSNSSRSLHLLYLGRRHPLKGLEYLEAAIAQLSNLGRSDQTLNSQIELRIVSSAFGEELEKIWDWCDVLVLPTLSDNFGLVIAEALERGKRVITTDGAPVWDPGGSGQNLGDRGQKLGASDEVGEGEDSSTSTFNFDSNILVGYGGRLLYLKGYRDGSKEKRVELLKKAIEFFRY